MTSPNAVLLAHFAGYLLQFRGSLISELVARGYQTTVIVPGLTPKLSSALADRGAKSQCIRLDRTGLNPFADAAYRKALHTILLDIRPDVTIAYGVKPIVHGIPVAAKVNCLIRAPLFAGLGGLVRPTGIRQRIMGTLARPMFARSLRASTHVATQNADDAEFLSKRFAHDLPGAPIITEGSGVDLAHFELTPPPVRPMVLMTARLVVEKGIWEFIDAAQFVRSSNPQVRFVIAGFFESRAGAASKEEFLARCEQAGVEYAGHVDDIRPLLRECSVFALPTYYGEGRPRSIQEALATGRPIVTTNNVGCHDSIVEGVHGRIVPPRNSSALAAAVLDVLAWPSPESTAVTCRNYAQQRYCATRIAREFLDSVGADGTTVKIG